MPVQYFCTTKIIRGNETLDTSWSHWCRPLAFIVSPIAFLGLYFFYPLGEDEKHVNYPDVVSYSMDLNGKNVDRHLKDGQANQWSTMA